MNQEIRPGVSETGFCGVWPGAFPPDAPMRPDPRWKGIRFTGRYANYTNADTWYPTWAEDGHLYSPWTDGYIVEGSPSTYQRFEESHPPHACNSVFWLGRRPATAQARIEGDDPMHLRIVDLPPRIEGEPWPAVGPGETAKFHGRYPCGSLHHNGVWSYGTYLLDNKPGVDAGGVGWTLLGPLVGFRTSRDNGRTWEPCPHTPDRPLFPEDPRVAPVRFGTPHFVDFGRNMRHSPDGLAYLVAHGSLCPDAWNTWIQGDSIYLTRVPPTAADVNRLASYEFFAGHDAGGSPRWTGKLSEAMPLIDWPGYMGCVTATYVAPLGLYPMCVTRGIKAGNHHAMLLASERITGPWRRVAWLDKFGPESYFMNIPSKFISADGKRFWLCYSANWSNKHHPGDPVGSHYSMSLREVELLE